MIASLNYSINKGFREFALFFPQMKPEQKRVLGLDLGSNSIGYALVEDENIIDLGAKIINDGDLQQYKNPIVASLGEIEKLILGILEKNNKLKIEDIKVQINISNKKWDKAIKELTSNKLVKVEKTDEGLFVEAL